MGLGRKGIASQKLEDFEDNFKWRAENFPDDKVVTKVAIPTSEYYEIGKYCIENNLSIVGFIRFAWRERNRLIQEGLIDGTIDNADTISYLVGSSRNDFNKGKLL